MILHSSSESSRILRKFILIAVGSRGSRLNTPDLVVGFLKEVAFEMISEEWLDFQMVWKNSFLGL